MRYLPIICFLFLFGCKSTTPSTSIANQVISDLNSHQKAIEQLDKQITKECKTEAFVATLNALKTQTDSIAGQVKSISQACKVEKQEIQNRIYTRDCIILFLLIFIVGYFLIKAKIILTGK